MPRRKTPEEDYDRLAERIQNEYGRYIKDKESFEVAYEKYLDDLPEDHNLFNKDIRDKIFDKIASSKKLLTKENLFREAGGKDLQRDRMQDAKKIVKTKKEYRQQGANRVDLEGYDTKQAFNARFNKAGRIHGRVVYVRQDAIKVKNRSQTVYRDRRGRFASLKTK